MVSKRLFPLIAAFSLFVASCGGSTELYTPCSTENGQGGQGGDGSAGSAGTGGSGGESPPPGLIIELDPNAVAPSIVIGGAQEWVTFSVYDVTNPTVEDMKLESLVIEQTNSNGDIADFTHVRAKLEEDALAEFANVCPQDDECPEWLTSNPLVADLNGLGFVIPAKTTLHLELEGKMAQVQPLAAVGNGEWHGFPRSGHSPSLEIKNVKANGVTSQPLEADKIPFRVLRRSHPLFKFNPLNEPLKNGVNTLAEVAISVETGQTVGLRQVLLTVTPSPGLVLEHDPTGSFMFFLNYALFVVVVDEPQIPYPPSGAMTLKLTAGVSGVTSGASIETRLYEFPTDESVQTFSLPFSPPPNGIYTAEGKNGEVVSSGLIWTDISEEENHVWTSPTSPDYSNKYLVPGAEDVAVITAP